MPRSLTSGAKAQGRFGAPDFDYLEQEKVYRCPVGEDLIYHYTSVEDGMTMHGYARLTGAVIRMAWEAQDAVPVHDRIEALIRAQGLLAGV